MVSSFHSIFLLFGTNTRKRKNNWGNNYAKFNKDKITDTFSILFKIANAHTADNFYKTLE